MYRTVELHKLVYPNIINSIEEIWDILLSTILSKGLLYKNFNLTLNITYLGYYFCVEKVDNNNVRIADTNQYFFKSKLLSKTFLDTEIDLKFRLTKDLYRIYFDDCDYYTLNLDEDEYAIESDDGIIQSTIELNTDLDNLKVFEKDFYLNMIKPFFLADIKIFNEAIKMTYDERHIKFCIKASQILYLVKNHNLNLEDSIEYAKEFINLTKRDETKLLKLNKNNFFNS